jgi:crossover junction endodeoxyribonuclease RuvC
MRVLAFDTSLSLPGVAIIEVKRGKPVITALSHVKTDSKTQSHGLRADIVESWATLFIAEHIGKQGFDVLIREDFHGQSSAQNYPVFAAWSGVERACDKFGLTFAKWQETGKGGRKKTLIYRKLPGVSGTYERIRKICILSYLLSILTGKRTSGKRGKKRADVLLNIT